ncbi:response regulator [Azospirillum doebereinerae]
MDGDILHPGTVETGHLPSRPALAPTLSRLARAAADGDPLTGWARGRGGRLLLVDDSATNRLVIGGLLVRAGFSVELAQGGAEAVVAVATAPIPHEAVLMDVSMPEVDGLSATATIRSLGGERGRVPIIAVTANAQPDDRDRCLDAGMNDYVTKPVRRGDLLAALERWLPRASSQKDESGS